MQLTAKLENQNSYMTFKSGLLLFCLPRTPRTTQTQNHRQRRRQMPACKRCVTQGGIQFREFEMYFTWLKSLQTTESVPPALAKPDHRPKTAAPGRPAPPKALTDNKTVTFKEEPTMDAVLAEIKELKMALELLEKRQEWVQLTSYVTMFKTWGDYSVYEGLKNSFCKTMKLRHSWNDDLPILNQKKMHLPQAYTGSDSLKPKRKKKGCSITEKTVSAVLIFYNSPSET